MNNSKIDVLCGQSLSLYIDNVLYPQIKKYLIAWYFYVYCSFIILICFILAIIFGLFQQILYFFCCFAACIISFC